MTKLTKTSVRTKKISTTGNTTSKTSMDTTLQELEDVRTLLNDILSTLTNLARGTKNGNR